MYRIGIDVGSTYTKYCVMRDETVESLFMERTPIRQQQFFDAKVRELRERFQDAEIVSCGYGRQNVHAVKVINELTALAKGSYYVTQQNGIVLDVGGQDTKVITQQNGQLREFFLNDKCAAGSGMFLINVMNMLGVDFDAVACEDAGHDAMHLSSVCAVFAQSEIVELIVGNVDEKEIIEAVIRQIFVKAKPLLGKVEKGPVLLSGGISQIKGIADFASRILENKCYTVESGAYLTAMGCAIK